MTHPSNDEVERFLAGLLSQPEAAAFERRLREEPALAEQVRLQREIDASLRRLFPAARSVPAEAAAAVNISSVAKAVEAALPGERRAGQASSPVAGRIWLQRLALAAVLGMGAFGAWSIWSFLSPMPVEPPLQVVQVQGRPGAYYQAKLTDGMDPAWVCKNNAEFAAAFFNQFGQPLLLSALPEGVAAGGMDYSPVMSPRTLEVLGAAGQTPLIVFVDELKDDPNFDCAVGAVGGVGGESLRIHRRALGKLVLYEVSPLPEAKLLDHFFIPESLDGLEAQPVGSDPEST